MPDAQPAIAAVPGMTRLARLQSTRAWDLAAAAPLILLCLFGAAGLGVEIHRQWPHRFDPAQALRIASEIVSAAFLLFQAVLVCMRRLPVARAAGIAPRFWALLGANFAFVLLFLPKAQMTPFQAILSGMLVLAGTAGSIVTLLWLRKAFAIFPQARDLVTTGPYKLVRHPLYLAEQVSAFGLAFQFLQPWALLIALAGFFLQFPRMRYEERVMRQGFPAYGDYARRTACIIPFLHWPRW